MFDSIKIITKCKKILKPFDIKYIDEYHVYKKSGFIHCKFNDWRGLIELDGFPVLTNKAAIARLIDVCAFEHYINLEKENRNSLINNYPFEYGEYEFRKYVFENILKVLKTYDVNVFNK